MIGKPQQSSNHNKIRPGDELAKDANINPKPTYEKPAPPPPPPPPKK